MKTKNPRTVSHGAGASKSTAADTEASTRNHPEPQQLDDLASYRAMVLLQRFAMQPETAAAMAVLAFGGGHG